MDKDQLVKIANAMVAKGKGILAADESTSTIQKRFDAIGFESTDSSRRDYREMMFRAVPAMKNNISGVILYDETICQNAKDGTPLVKLIEQAGSLPGIKVDKGTKPLPFCPGELITEGLDGLGERMDEYRKIGARFAKWRAVIDIGPGIPFLPGGQSEEEATAPLNLINRLGPLAWPVTFSYGRALQHEPQKLWAGKPENVAAAQRAFSHRAQMNGLAAQGQWKADLEKAA